MNWTKEQISDYEERITYMEKYVKAYRWESCGKILAYLQLYGKMKASEINEKVGLEGKKSIYRSLKVLLETGVIGKEYQDDSQRNAYYYHKGEMVNDPKFDEKFLEYIIQKKKYGLISDYLASTNKSTTEMITTISEIMKEIIEEQRDPKIGEKFIQNTFFLELLFSFDKPEIIKQEIKAFLEERLEPLLKSVQTTSKSPMQSPNMFYLAYVPLIKK